MSEGFPPGKVRIEVEKVSFFYGAAQALKDITLAIPSNQVTAFIGPSGCGKSTLLRLFNRMNDLIAGSRMEGTIRIDGEDIYAPSVDVVNLRRKVGMVFQKPNPFPKSIIDNVTFGLEVTGRRNAAENREKAVDALKKAALWGEVRDRLAHNALRLSGGQQQRLCIARCLAVQPEVLLFDEPCASLDPISTRKIEELIVELKREYTIVIVTHNLQQAGRISDYTAFLYLGELIEFGRTETLFTTPQDRRTEDYITGKFG